MSHVRPLLAHLGIFVTDLAGMEQFYTSVFGLLVTDRGVGAVFNNDLVFMSAAEDQHHQVVLSGGRAPGTPSTIMQLSFKVKSLDQLREVKNRALQCGATELIGLNHGNAWSLYFYDPEQNRIEVYLDTEFHTPQPCAHPLDLDDSDDDIMQVTRALIDQLPGSMARDAYIKEMQARLS